VESIYINGQKFPGWEKIHAKHQALNHLKLLNLLINAILDQDQQTQNQGCIIPNKETLFS